MPFDLGRPDARVDPPPRVKTLRPSFTALVTAMSATAISAMDMFVVPVMSMHGVVICGVVVRFVRIMLMKRIALHVDPAVEIAVGLMYHGIRQILLGVSEQNGQKIPLHSGLRQPGRRHHRNKPHEKGDGRDKAKWNRLLHSFFRLKITCASQSTATV